MKQIILHIGQTKTGSTALQHFFQKNKESLSRSGYAVYEPLHTYHGSMRVANGAFLLHDALQHLKGDRYQEAEKLREETAAFQSFAASQESFLLTDELYLEYAPGNDGLWDAVQECLREYFKEEPNIHIVLYLRRQDEWLLSWWKQLLQTNSKRTPQTFPDFVSQMERSGQTDYDALLQRLEAAFGKEQITVRVYDRRAFSGGDICHDFLSQLGIPWQEDFTLQKHDPNPSLTLDAAEALYLIRSGKVPSNASETALQNAALLFSSMYPEKKPFYPISEENRRSLLEHFQEGNRRVEARYHLDSPIIRDAARVFETRLPDPERDWKNAELIVKLTTAPSGAARYLSERLTN